MNQWTRTRTTRLLAILVGLCMLLTACDATDVLQFIGGPGAGTATTATPRRSADARTPATTKRDSSTRTPAATQRGSSTARSTATGARGAAADLSATERRIHELLTAARRTAGVRALTLSRDISRGARSWSCTMADSGNLRHADLRSAGVSGENIAWGQRTAAEVHRGWMTSPGHRSNRLNARWTEYGVGVCTNDDGRLFFTERFR